LLVEASTSVGKGYFDYAVVEELPIQNSSTKQYVLTLLVIEADLEVPDLVVGSPPVYPTFYNYHGRTTPALVLQIADHIIKPVSTCQE
jgi:hypothetical protein